jgi:phosphatidylserine/phosphatidylglycerophosphate/cardiolipin synthase-like enzyme
MEKRFSNSGNNVRTGVRARQHRVSRSALWIAGALLSLVAPASAAAQERLFLTAVDNAQQELLTKIRNEQVRIDVAVWFIGDGDIAAELIKKHKAGVPVRVIGDRVAIFEADADTRRLFELMASEGVPIRLRYHPTSFPEVMHWKCAIFVGQNVVEFGSANYTTFELAPWSAINFKDETALFSNDPTLVRAFLTMFDRMWADTSSFLDWPAAYRSDTGITWPRPMSIPAGRREPDYPTDVPGMVWGQGPELVSRMVAEINSESQRIDLVSYRLTVPEITDALIRRHQAGVPVRVFIEQTQYRNIGYPEYWLVGAMADRLWAAGVPIKQRAHQGLTHMKSLVTSQMGMFGSSNFTRYWQRDHNYFVAANAKPAIYFALRDRIDAMWNDTVNYAQFQPQRPEPVPPESPGNGAANVATASALVWRRAPWAVAFDVYMGPSPSSLTLAGRVNAAMIEDPPQTYAFFPPQGLAPSTRYYWQIVSRTYASDLNPSLTAGSAVFTFVTSATTSPAVAGPAGCVGPSPGAGWTCVKGGWIPPGGWTPPPPSSPPSAPSPTLSPTPTPSSTSCPGTAPVAGWLCINGGWIPPDHPLALAAGTTPPPSSAPSQPAPAPVPSTCTTIKPASNWVCVNGGWVPPDSPLAATAAVPAPTSPPPSLPTTSCTTPDPFVALGGGVCVGGGWVPKGHPLAGGGGT